jgi:pimeloyl-ACP methyl ester carboxylesterase
MLEHVTSSDGTRIGFSRSGSGPPLVLVHGSTADRTRWINLLPRLERSFTVLAMDRRGRGASGDSDPWRIALEYDDVAAVVRAAGPDACLLGHSFGALCAMEAALQVTNLRRLVLYEPPFPVEGAQLYSPGQREQLEAVFASGDREGFLQMFFREVVGVDDAMIEALRADPSWRGRLKSAGTAVRELADGDYRFEPARFAGMRRPTLLLLGETSAAEFGPATRALDAALPDSRIVMLKGQGHVAMTSAPDLFLNAVTSFLAA